MIRGLKEQEKNPLSKGIGHFLENDQLLIRGTNKQIEEEKRQAEIQADHMSPEKRALVNITVKQMDENIKAYARKKEEEKERIRKIKPNKKLIQQ